MSAPSNAGGAAAPSSTDELPPREPDAIPYPLTKLEFSIEELKRVAWNLRILAVEAELDGRRDLQSHISQIRRTLGIKG